MLLDKYVLTKGLTSLLSHSTSASASTTAQSGYLKRVNSSMARLDPLLKTLQVRPSPPEGLVQAYLIHIGDRSDTNFRKILDLKGVRKMDQPALVELFGVHRDGKSNEHLMAMNPLLTPLMNATGLGSGGLGINSPSTLVGSSGIPMPTRFDPTGFSEKLFSAARDGVERMGTGAVGVGGTGERIGSPLADEAKVAVEGNLKSIGKFFRRDMSGFSGMNIGGRFGGKKDGTADDTVR